MSDISDLRENLRAARAHLAARLATSPTAFGADPLNQVVATLDQHGFVADLQIAPTSLVDRTHTELAELITDVLRDGTSRLNEGIRNAFGDTERMDNDFRALLEGVVELVDGDPAPARPEPSQRLDRETDSRPVVMECSANGLLGVAVDYSGGQVRVQLQSELLRSWSAARLAERIMRLHRLALMRARAEMRVRLMVETGASLPTTRGWPSPGDVEEFRRSIDF